VNVGIVGAGNISATHARGAEAAGLRVVGVFGENPSRTRTLAGQHGATPYDSIEALLADRAIDLVLIGSPSGRHAEQAAAAIRARRHVLVEKPLDISSRRIDALLDEVRRADVMLGVFFQDRLKPDVLALKQSIDAGIVGTPVLATGEVKWSRSATYYSESKWRGTWELDGGGALMNQGIHTVDLMLYLLGPVVRASGSIATRAHAIEAEDTAVATLEFASGVLGTLVATTAAPDGQPRRLEIIGSAGSLVLEGDRMVTPGTNAASILPESATSAVVSDIAAHQRIIDDFVAAIRDGRSPVCDGYEARRSVAVVEAVYRSAREKIAVEPE
jgi:UDP-N-acetyl-2-amino-2-deoxyglucuronate dehydrogenase